MESGYGLVYIMRKNNSAGRWICIVKTESIDLTKVSVEIFIEKR